MNVGVPTAPEQGMTRVMASSVHSSAEPASADSRPDGRGSCRPGGTPTDQGRYPSPGLAATGAV